MSQISSARVKAEIPGKHVLFADSGAELGSAAHYHGEDGNVFMSSIATNRALEALKCSLCC